MVIKSCFPFLIRKLLRCKLAYAFSTSFIFYLRVNGMLVFAVAFKIYFKLDSLLTDVLVRDVLVMALLVENCLSVLL